MGNVGFRGFGRLGLRVYGMESDGKGILEHGLQTGRLCGSFPKIGEPQYRPQNTIVLIIGTPKRVPLILGNPLVGMYTV